MRYYWYGTDIGGFSNISGELPMDIRYKFIGQFEKYNFINSNMCLIKCTDSENLQKRYVSPFKPNKKEFDKQDILNLYESMDESDKIVIYEKCRINKD